jgi:hypothetical protein
VVGPASATDNAVARFDLTTGKIIQNSAVIVDDTGNVGIGTTSPTLPLNIGTSTLPAGVTINGQMISSDVADTTPLLSLRRSAAIGNPIFAQFTSAGTAAAPTAIALNRGLGRNDWWGFDGTNYINAAAVSVAADGAVSAGVVPGRIVFATSATNTPVEAMRITSAGNVGIGTATPTFKLQVVGSFAATTKSFVIDHPTKSGMKLRYGSLEGPENGVYVRGKTQTNIIELPEYWTKLINPESITVQLTPIGHYQTLYVEKIEDNKVYISSDNLLNSSINCYFNILAERIDVEKLEVEIK